MPAPPVITTAKVDLSTNGKEILASINGNEATSLGIASTAEYDYGTEISLKAVADEGQEFMYWKENYETSTVSTIISGTDEYSFIVGSSRILEAVFAEKEEYTVSFRSNGKIVAYGALKEVPQDPYMAGYVFDGWYKFGGGPTELKAGEAIGELTENVIYQAAFKKENKEYTVTVENAENKETVMKQYNDKVSVGAADVEGMNFACWERDGKIVSYSKTYSFYVSADTELKAVYTAEVVETPDVIVTLATPAVVAGNKLAYYAERNVKEGLTVVEAGILLNQTADFDINTAQIKAVAKQTTHQGQFTVRKANVTSDQTWYGKAYVIYKDAEGVTQFAYSEMVGPNTVK